MSLLGVPDDLLIIICDFLPVRDVKTMSITHSAFRRAAEYRLLRDVNVNLAQRIPLLLRSHLQYVSGRSVSKAVRTMDINDSVTPRREPIAPKKRKPEYEQDLEMVREVLRSATGIRLLNWRGDNIPRAILDDILDHHPLLKVSLHLEFGSTRVTAPRFDIYESSLRRLAHCENLHALDVRLAYTREQECGRLMKLLKEVLLSCSSLRKLKLDVYMPSAGCVVYLVPTEYHGLGLTGIEAPPALKELDLCSYPFGQVRLPDATKPWQLESTKGYPMDLDEHNYWADRFDWILLERLSIFNAKLAVLLAPQLTALQEVSLCSVLEPDLVGHFLRSVPSCLKKITVTYVQKPDTDAILRHKETLQGLSFCMRETYSMPGPWDTQCLNLQDLCNSCLSLTELEMCIARTNEDWPYHTLSLLSTLQKLRRLTLWFELGLCQADAPPVPLVTFSAASGLFRYLRTQNPRLEELVVGSGRISGKALGLIDDDGYWPEENATVLHCSLSERDDGAARGDFTTTCDTVNNEHNQWMRAQEGQAYNISQAMKDLSFEAFAGSDPSCALSSSSRLALRVAWKGPLSVNDWRVYNSHIL